MSIQILDVLSVNCLGGPTKENRDYFGKNFGQTTTPSPPPKKKVLFGCVRVKAGPTILSSSVRGRTAHMANILRVG